MPLFYGHSFSNDSDIKFRFDNRKMSFSCTYNAGSGNASLPHARQYGNRQRVQYIPLKGVRRFLLWKGFSTKLAFRGDADFTVWLGGKWDNPQINGNLNVSNGLFGLKDMHHSESAQ